jgi:hypothetical protein
MYKNKLNRQWNPCEICKWGSDKTTQEEFSKHCEKCNELASEWEESNEFKQFKVGVEISKAIKDIQKKSEEVEKLKKYPLLLMASPEVTEEILNMNEEANKKGIHFVNIADYNELTKYKDKKHFELYVLLCPNTIDFRDCIYKDDWIMENMKVFTVYHELGSKYLINKDPFQDWKKKQKEILDLKLDRRFDQIPLRIQSDYIIPIVPMSMPEPIIVNGDVLLP